MSLVSKARIVFTVGALIGGLSCAPQHTSSRYKNGSSSKHGPRNITVESEGFILSLTVEQTHIWKEGPGGTADPQAHVQVDVRLA